MIKLAVKSIIFMSLTLFASNLYSYIILDSPLLINVFDVYKAAANVSSIIDKSKYPGTSEVVILGDSVAKQLSKPGDSNFILSAPATFVGQYIVLNNILKANKNVRKVVMISYPGALRMKFDDRYTYNQFIKPFYNTDNTQYISDTAEAYLKRHRYYYLYKLPMTKVLPVFTFIDCSHDKPEHPDESYEYSIFIEYMNKIIELCNARHIELKVLAPPVSDSHYNSFDFDKLRRTINDNGYANVFSCYFDTMLVKDDIYYNDDHWHYKKQYEDEMATNFRENANKCVSLPMF